MTETYYVTKDNGRLHIAGGFEILSREARTVIITF